MLRRPTLSLPVCALLLGLAPPARADPPSLLDRPVVLAATRLAVARAGLDDGASHALAARARHAAWLPHVSVRVARNTGAATTQYAAASGDRQLLDDSLFVDVRVTLSLDRLVFDPHEAALARLDAQRAEHRLRLEAAVLDALTRCEQLRRRAATEASDVVDRLAAQARVEQLTGVSIDALLAAR